MILCDLCGKTEALPAKGNRGQGVRHLFGLLESTCAKAEGQRTDESGERQNGAGDDFAASADHDPRAASAPAIARWASEDLERAQQSAIAGIRLPPLYTAIILDELRHRPLICRGLLRDCGAGARGANPLAGDPAAIREGASLFRANCSPCHGLNAGGGGRGPNLRSGLWIHGGSDEAIFRTISQGVPGTEMPANSFEDSETWALVAYLRSVSRAAQDSR